MYLSTYGKIGTHLNTPHDLLDYDLWELCGDPINSFCLSKVTSYGIKLGILGSDGSSEGKSQVKEFLKPFSLKRGRYGEVSHKVEEIFHRNNSPVVCSSLAQKVLGKPLEPLSDGIHYRRNLGSLGKLTKVLVGRPLGVKTTEWENPSCPISKMSYSGSTEDTFEPLDYLEHLSCLL